MSDPRSPTPEEIRREAAAEEREAILDIVERYMRQLSHGHGAGGAQILQRISDEIHQRGRTGDA